MRESDVDLDAEVVGTSYKDTLEVNAWRGGELVAEHLDVLSWSLSWDATRQVQGQLSIVFADPDGTLAPWTLSDALAPGGSQLQVTWRSGSTEAEVPVGWYRIRKGDPREEWRIQYDAAGLPVWIPGGGGQIAVDADDLTCIPADLDRLDAEPVVELMTLAEVSRLLDDVIPVAFDETITDLAVPSSLVYEDGRMDAVEDHLSRIYAVYRMNGAGELEVIPEDGYEAVWTLAGGNDGVLISLARSMSDDGIYNAAISSAEPDYGDSGEDPIQLVGRDYILDGPLAWGPATAFGRVPIFHQSPATTQRGVNADARTLLANRQKTATAELSVECLLHPALQIYDRVTLVPPSTEGDYPIVGTVMSMQIAGTDVIEKRMTLGVRVTANVLEALASKARSRVHG